MSKFINFYSKQDPLIFWSVILCLVFIFLTIITYFLGLGSLPTRIPLFYSLPWGEDQLASPIQFIVIPSANLLILLINLIISWHLHSSQLILKRILLISSLAISFLLFITTFKIVFLFI